MGRVVLHREYSDKAVGHFTDRSIDFVYVDAMHSYEGCLQDLILYAPKVTPAGVLFGHDFSNTIPGRRKRFGVVRAVADFLARSDFMPVLVTMENAPSYVLTRHLGSRDKWISSALAVAPGVLVPFRLLVQMEQISVLVDAEKQRKVELIRL